MFRQRRLGRLIAGMVMPLVVSFFLLSARSPAEPQGSSLSPADSIDILHYTLNLRITDLKSRQIHGIADLQAYTLLDSVHTVPLMLEPPLVVDSVWIDEERVRYATGPGNAVVVFLPEVADRESTILLTLFYHGHPARDPRWGGFYFMQHTAFNMGVGMNVIPHPFGRAWFPCRDNFTDKATYDYFITVPDTLTAACPGTLQAIIPNAGHTRTFHWNLSSPVSTYLSSVAVSRYALLNDSLRGKNGLIPAQYFVKPENKEKAKITFSHVQQYLTIYEDLFGPYPWEKIGYAEVPFPHGAMEHATCISIPDNAVDGTHDHDILLAHEFSHSWFGNLVTCKSAGDMWLNEGWATYCEALYLEYSRGEEAYTRYISANHKRVLQYAHITDDGYHALANVPEEITYGTTVYKKGADVICTLRNFLGDKDFFDAMKIYFGEYSFKNISTEEFEHFLTRVTHRNLQDFFNTWVYTPGFPHFSIDSLMVIRDRDDYITGLFLRQRLKGRKAYAIDVPVEVTLLDDMWQEHRFTVSISGPRQRRSLITSFPPAAVMINTGHFVQDATTSDHHIIRHPGSVTFDNCFFTLQVSEISDSAYLRIVHHWIGPEHTASVPGDLEISAARYWSVEGILPVHAGWQGSFYYNFTHSMRGGYLDTLASPQPGDSLLLLYRAGLPAPWHRIPATIKGNLLSGYLQTDSIGTGDYCLAVKRRKAKTIP